jgi:hypothetical protein
LKILLFLSLSTIIFGCASGQYNPNAGDCEKSGLFVFKDIDFLRSKDLAYEYCIEKRNYQSRLKNDPEFAKSEALKQQEAEKAEKAEQAKLDKEKREAEILNKNRMRVKQPGSDIHEFVKYFGEPTTSELMDGKLILWYDLGGSMPVFVHFKNNKLTDIIMDRVTYQNREAMTDANRRHYENLKDNETTRNQLEIMNTLNNIEADRRSRRQTTTNCTKDYYGNVNCTSN